jgi:hypothetical protein
MKGQDENEWITQGLKVSCKRLWCCIGSTSSSSSSSSFIFPPYGYIVTWDSSVNNLHNQYEELSISLSTTEKTHSNN